MPLSPRGTVEDTELVEGLVLDQKASHYAGGITRVEKAKIGLIQFCISPPKTDVSGGVACWEGVEGSCDWSHDSHDILHPWLNIHSAILHCTQLALMP